MGLRLSPHDFRRSMTTVTADAGGSSRLLQIQGGWQSLALLERYTASLRKPDSLRRFLPLASRKAESSSIG